jgi:mono/diheme cytochrome c family protein
MLTRVSVIGLAAALFVATFVTVTGASSWQKAPPDQQGQAAQRTGGWTLPADADQEKNPVAGDAAAIAAGKQLFSKKCQRCHGQQGKGDGPDADPDNQQDMDLTNPRRAVRNPDGVVFYKLWNGRSKPKMPAFKDELTKDQAWQIVSYVQTLREKQ